MARTYRRNGVWGWSLEEQEKALTEAGKLDPNHAYKDELPEAKAKKPSFVKPEWLAGRADLLRPSGRRTGEEIAVATLPVLAPNETDLVSVIRQAGARRATITAVDSGFRLIAYQATIEDIEAAIKDWQRSKASARTKPGRTAGYLAAAEKKRSETDRKLPIAKPLWNSRKWDRPSVQEIAAVSGLSTKTLYNRLPPRPRRERKSK